MHSGLFLSPPTSSTRPMPTTKYAYAIARLLTVSVWPQPRRDWGTLLLLTCMHLAALLFPHGAAAAGPGAPPFRVALVHVSFAPDAEALRDGILRKLESRGESPGRVHIELFAMLPSI